MAGFTVTQLEAIERAIASGTLKVRYDGKEVQYQTMGELINARRMIREELIADGLLASTPTRGMTTVTEFFRD
ncbi:phage head-tail joining protein [Polaromonas sp.]|uniref:phage head-tail joining protein n=1 Tax=Polaromonas sp. TaxID=1869339 RepID=UPI003BB61837